MAQLNTTAGAGLTVNVFVHVCGVAVHDVVYVQVTVVFPPHADGAVGVTGLLVNTPLPLHPPLAVAVANHAVNFVSIALCI